MGTIFDNYLEKSFTIKELIEFVKKYDDNGEISYPEREYEGQEFIKTLLEDTLMEDIADTILTDCFDYGYYKKGE